MRKLMWALCAVLGIASSSQAVVITYANLAAFNAAAPGLPVEGFQNANTSASVGFNGPLNSATNNFAFSPGDILPGITITDSTPASVDLFIAGPGQSSNPTIAVGSNFPSTDTLNLVFSPTVTAVAFDLFQNFGGGFQSGSPQTYTVSLFGVGNVLLGSFNTTVPSGSGGFFGATSTDAITRITINGPAGAFEVIDNVRFGQAAAVPEPISLVVFGGLVLGGGLVARKRLMKKAVA
jgi:hypothetical protein